MADTPADRDFTYPEVGATRGALPAGYDHLRLRREIGRGRADFERLGDAVLAFRIQRGLRILDHAETPVAEPGAAVTVRLGLGPLGLRAPCRVVYVLDEENRRGFVYGTLAGHPARGEELFAVDYDPATGTVYGETVAFSRPATWYTRLGGPLTRLAQRLAARAYLATLRRTPR
ncbi:DUF1990 domain-containing protein [Nocardia farcinica]|uniref:DUF1990 family protein n=1 Tax=Nocardia farcinica TaxID=37329 RepID=UPI0018955B40|nr:DUF1990 domain-containing protein [Nocardia farcinica]MBF6443272.1 DUF1990 domain-containing protein [Nocardia farcinica]